MKVKVNFETKMIEVINKECNYSVECCKKFKQALIDGMNKDVYFVSSLPPHLMVLITHPDNSHVSIKTRVVGKGSFVEDIMTISEYQQQIYKLFSKVYQLA